MRRTILFISIIVMSFGLNAQTTLSSNASSDTLFFEQGSEWKYLDNGSNQDTAWQDLNFDDSQWDVGEGHMGFGEGDETTTLTSGYITYYFRKIVHIADTSEIDSIYFNIVHDDGAVAHVNGHEVLRSSLMPSGPITYLTGTTTFIPNDVENDFWSYAVPKSYFQNGDNIIAIEIHNQRVGSSDVSFDCYISDSFSFDYKLDGPYVFYRNDEILVKTVESTGVKTYTYQDPSEVVLTCRFQNGVDSFNVTLQPNLTIEPSDYALPDKFLAISDIEGNLEAFVMVLQDAGVIDEDYNWTFDDGHLFFVGDMFDRGNNVAECLWLLYRLESQAEIRGGKIHFVMGNHDIMNLIYDFRYVSQKYLNNVQLMGETLESLYADDTELGRWLRTKNIVERAGPFVFLHAGVSTQVHSINATYDQLNDWARDEMDGNCSGSFCITVNSSVGLYWYRGMAEETLAQQQVDDMISQLGGEMVVIGHTVFDDITLLYNEKVICIDLDHKDNYAAGFMSALYYENGSLFDFHTDGTNQTYTLLRTITGIEQDGLQPQKFSLDANYPNPFNPTTRISYSIPMASNVELSIFNQLGQEVRTLSYYDQPIGSYQVEWDGKDNQGISLTSGVYFYRLKAGSFVNTRKMILLR
ncbi:MAG: FlgD immunoglobulin-like domain containing protein [Calditrichia bacterium]